MESQKATKQGRNSTILLWIPIPVSFDIFYPSLVLVTWDDMLDCDMYILLFFFESAFVYLNGKWVK